MSNPYPSHRTPTLLIGRTNFILIVGLFIYAFVAIDLFHQPLVRVLKQSLAVVFVVIMLLSLKDWKYAVPFLFTYMVVYGFMNRIYHPSKLPLILLDVVVMVIYLGFFLRYGLRVFELGRQPLAFPLVFFLIYLSFQLFNPFHQYWLIGVLGFKLYVFYIPLIIVGKCYFSSREEIIQFMIMLLVISIPVSSYGIYQYFKGIDAIIELGPGFRDALIYTNPDPVKGIKYMRTISTFASPGLFGYFLATMMWVGFVMLNIRLSQLNKVIVFTSLFLTGAALLTSGSRSPFIIVILALSFVYGFNKRIRTLLVAASIFMVVVFAGRFWLNESIIDSRFHTIFLGSEYHQRFYGTFLAQIPNVLGKDWLGMGLGVASVSSRHLTGGVLVYYYLVESYVVKILVEMGLPGLLLFGWFLGALLLVVYRIWRHLQNVENRWIAGSILGYLVVYVLNLLVGVHLDSPTSAIYFWFFTGLVFRLYELEKTENSYSSVLKEKV